jgi:hypothetical protein
MSGRRGPPTVNDELTLLSHAYKLAMMEWEWASAKRLQGRQG